MFLFDHMLISTTSGNGFRLTKDWTLPPLIRKVCLCGFRVAFAFAKVDNVVSGYSAGALNPGASANFADNFDAFLQGGKHV